MAIRILLAIGLLFGLTACAVETKQTCEEKGGKWELHIWTQLTLVGKNLIPMTQSDYECEGGK